MSEEKEQTKAEGTEETKEETKQSAEKQKESETKTVTETKTDDTKKEKVSFEKDEFEQRLNNKFAEGAKKAEKNLLEELGFDSKDDLKEIVKSNKELSEKYDSASQELSNLKAERLAIKLGADAEIAENAVALLKGKDKEINEENMKEAIKIFNGNSTSRGFGTTPKNRTADDDKKAPPKVF